MTDMIMDDPNLLTMGQVIRMLREHRGLSQVQLAQRAGISRSHLNLLENDKRDDAQPRAGTMEGLARALDVPETLLVQFGDTHEARTCATCDGSGINWVRIK